MKKKIILKSTVIEISPMQINIFQETPFYDIANQIKRDILTEMESEQRNKILSVEEVDYVSYLNEKYQIENIEIDLSSEIINEPKKTKTLSKLCHCGNCYVNEYDFEIVYSFKGDSEILKYQPNNRWEIYQPIFLDDKNSLFSFTISIQKTDSEKFIKEKNKIRDRCLKNYDGIKRNINEFNSTLKEYIIAKFNKVKEEFQNETDFFQKINVTINKDSQNLLYPQKIQKKSIPKPTIKEKDNVLIPTLKKSVYQDIIETINKVGKLIEKKPSVYKEKYEEDLRDQILLFLENRYEGTTATGETFNNKGKTDILLKYEDGTNIFIAECKFWKGEIEFAKAINQLFDKYLTWRDSKAAIILFVTNKGFTQVLDKIKEKAKDHEYFKKFISETDDSSFSYEFYFPSDKEKIVYLEIIAFHMV